MITLQAPAYAIVETVTLRNPETPETVDKTRDLVIHRSLAGTVRTVVSDSNLGLTGQKIELEFRLVKQSDSDAISKFIQKYKSDYIKYTDYDGHVWVCIYADDTLEIVPAGPNGRYDIALTLNRWPYA